MDMNQVPMLDRSSESDIESFDDLFQILKRLKEESPQSETHSAATTVKAGHVEVTYTISITSRKLD